MAQGNVVFVTKINHYFRLEGNNIICYDFSRTTKSGQDVSFKELDNDRFSSIPRWYGFYPFGKVIGGSENPIILG